MTKDEFWVFIGLFHEAADTSSVSCDKCVVTEYCRRDTKYEKKCSFGCITAIKDIFSKCEESEK